MLKRSRLTEQEQSSEQSQSPVGEFEKEYRLMKNPSEAGKHALKMWSFLLAVVVTLILNAVPLLAQETNTEKEHYVVGVAKNLAPYSFLDENNLPVGYNVDITNAIAKVMQMDIEVIIAPFGELRQALEKGEIDAMPMYYSEKWKKIVNFSVPYSTMHNAIFIRKDSPEIKTEEELHGKNIIVINGDIMHDYILENNITDNLVTVPLESDALKLLASGEHDCALLAQLPGLYWVKKLELSNIITVGPLMVPSQICYAVAKGNANLQNHLSEGLATLGENGEHDRINDLWLGILIPRGISPSKVFEYIAIVVVPLLLLLLSIVVWTRTLKRQVSQRTRELRENEKYLDNIINNIGDPLFVKDDQSRIIVANEAFCKLFGRQRDEIIGKTLAEDVPPEEQESFLMIDKQVLMNGQENINEETLTIRGGETLIISTKKTRFIDDDGKKFLIGVSRDITERKQAEEEKEQSKSLLKAALESTADGILVVGIDGRWASVNQKFINMWGIPTAISESNDDQAGLDYIFETLVSPEEFMAKVSKLYDNPEMDSFDTIELKDGRIFERYSHPQRLEDEVVGRVWSFRDITEYRKSEEKIKEKSLELEKQIKKSEDQRVATLSLLSDLNVTTKELQQEIIERRKSEGALQESEERYRQFFDDDLSGDFLSTPEGKIIDCNEAWRNMFGFSTIEEARQVSTYDLYPENKMREKKLQLLREKKKLVNFEEKMQKITGEEINVLSNLIGVFDKDENLFQLKGYIVDITKRKKAEEELVKQQFYLESAQVIGSIGTWELDTIKNELFWTKETYRIFGVPIGTRNLTYETFLECIHPDDKKYVNDEWTKSLKTKNYDIEHRILVDGNVKWIREKADLHFDKEGNCINAVGVSQDITARKQAEKELKVSEEKFRKAFITSPDSININRLKDGLYIETNNGFTKIMGYTENEVIGKTSIELNIWANPSDRNKFIAGLQVNGFVDNLECKFRSKSGELIDGLMSATVIELNGERHILSIVRDITNRKQAEEDIRKSEERFKKVVETTGDWIWEIDKDGLFTYSSKVSENLLGYKPDEIVGKKYFYDFFKPEIKDEFKSAAFEVFSKKESFSNFENPNIHRDGRVVIINTSASPILDEKGNLLGYRGADRDITKRREAEMKLKSKNNELQVFNNIMVGRENRMIDLKNEINNLLVQQGKSPKYDTPK